MEHHCLERNETRVISILLLNFQQTGNVPCESDQVKLWEYSVMNRTKLCEGFSPSLILGIPTSGVIREDDYTVDS